MTKIEGVFDYVVIGTGAGGATAGKELAERGYSVAFVEEGREHKPEEHRDLASSALTRLYRDQGLTFAMGTPGFPVLHGCAVGGTTVINSGTCFRTPAHVHERWNRELGLTGVGETELAPHFDFVEKALHVGEAEFDKMSEASRRMYSIFKKHGYDAKPLRRNSRNCVGRGMCAYGCAEGAKQSMDVSFIPAALRAGARLFTGFRAQNILMNGGRATGVLSSGGRVVEGKNIIVAAGTLNTPPLLTRSGLGKSRALGRHLTVHPACKVYAEFADDINGWEGIPQACYVDLVEKHGVLFEGVFVPPDLASVMNLLPGGELHQFMRRYHKMLSFGFMIEDTTTGTVVSPAGQGPFIFYSLSQKDADRIKWATLLLAELLLKNGALKVFTMIRREPGVLTSLNDVEKLRGAKVTPADVEVAAFHPLGTARLGRNINEGVADSAGLMFGTENVFVADGSAIPTSLGVNPQLTIMAMARRLAFHLAGAHG